MLNTSENGRMKQSEMIATYGQQMHQSELKADANGILFQYKRAEQIKMVTKVIKLSLLLYVGLVTFILLASPTFRINATLFILPFVITFIPTLVIIITILRQIRPTYFDAQQQTFNQGRRQRSLNKLHTIVVRRNLIIERYRSSAVEHVCDEDLVSVSIELHLRSPLCKSFGDFRFGIFQNTEQAFEYATALADALDFKGPVTIDKPHNPVIIEDA